MEKYKLIKSEYNERTDFYESDFYKIRVQKFEGGGFSYVVNKKVEGLPTIYIKDDWKDITGNEYDIECVEIQTTSYGTMDIEGIERLIEGYKIAIETVKEIKKIFGVK